MAEQAVPLHLVAPWIEPAGVRRAEPLTGGFVNAVYRIDDQTGARYVLRVQPPSTTPEMVSWEHALLRDLSVEIPEVVVPLPARGGGTYVSVDDTITSFWPYIEGRSPSARERLTSPLRWDAARLLGRIHAVAGAAGSRPTRPGWPPWALMDWHENHWWSSAAALAALSGDRGQRELLERALRTVPPALRTLGVHGWSLRPIHADYGLENMRVRGDVIVAVIDWDFCRLDWRIADVAAAVWDACRDPDSGRFDTASATRYVAAYEEAGDSLFADEREALPLLVRARCLFELLWELARRPVGAGDRRLHRKLTVLDELANAEAP